MVALVGCVAEAMARTFVGFLGTSTEGVGTGDGDSEGTGTGDGVGVGDGDGLGGGEDEADGDGDTEGLGEIEGEGMGEGDSAAGGEGVPGSTDFSTQRWAPLPSSPANSLTYVSEQLIGAPMKRKHPGLRLSAMML